MEQNPADLFKLVQTQMPFGKYSGRALIDLPDSYVEWFSRKGFPEGDLGRLLGLLYEVKSNGLDYLFHPIRDLLRNGEMKL